MSRTCHRTILGILLTASFLTLAANSQVKRGEPEATGPCPDQKAWIGRYRNYVYGFSIFIPAGLKGYWNSLACVPEGKHDCVCMGDHGRFIPLSDDTHIEAYVDYQNESDWTVLDQEREDIANLRGDKNIEQVRVVSSRWFRLGNLNARRFVAHFVEHKKSFVTDRIFAQHNGVEYQLDLRTVPESYQRDEARFRKVIASWRLTPRMG